MKNIISGSDYANRWTLSQSCCGSSLRAGSLCVGVFCLLFIIPLVIQVIFFPFTVASVFVIIDILMILVMAVFIFTSVCMESPRLLWITVYIALSKTACQIVTTITYFIFGTSLEFTIHHKFYLFISLMSLLLLVFDIYFFLLLRSYSYEVEKKKRNLNDSPVDSQPPSPGPSQPSEPPLLT